MVGKASSNSKIVQFHNNSTSRCGLDRENSSKELKMDRIKSKWEFLLQCRPDILGIIGNSKLIGGDISYNSNNEKIFYFITKKSTFSYNEAIDEFKSKLQIR
jgi:hypothetical protein